MKKITFGLIAVSLIAAFACKNQPAKEEAKDPASTKAVNDPTPTTVKISVDSAALHIQRYIAVCESTLGVIPIKGFTIRSRDLLEVLGLPLSYTSNCTYNHARVYLGLAPNYGFKLYINPVLDAHLEDNEGGQDTVLSEPDAYPSGYVLDLNTPCPQVCASNNIYTFTPIPPAKK